MSAPRPYHHGDLRRALIVSARKRLEIEGEGALSLRATARDAGASPAALYHHFKDKADLLAAVAEEGYRELIEELMQADIGQPAGKRRLTALGAAYVSFAVRQRALHQLMTRISRGRQPLTEGPGLQIARLMRDAVSQSCRPGTSERDIQLASLAYWSAIHGLADLATFTLLEGVKSEFGGEQAFLRSVLEHLDAFADAPGG